MIKHGALKPENEHGYSEEQLDALASGESLPRKEILRNGFVFYECPDPTGRRIGEALGKEAEDVLRKALYSVDASISKVAMLSIHFF